MIENVMEKWFAVVGGNGDIRELLHEDCVFWSPVLFHPQVGAELTAMYLSAAGMVFPGDDEKGMKVSLGVLSTQREYLMAIMRSLSSKRRWMVYQSTGLTLFPAMMTERSLSLK